MTAAPSNTRRRWRRLSTTLVLMAATATAAAPPGAPPMAAAPSNTAATAAAPSTAPGHAASGAGAGQTDPRRSGREDMTAPTRAMQDDDRQNPGLLWLQTGQALWRQRSGAAQRSCADCHGEPAQMRGVAPRYPAWDATTAGPLTLGQRIAQCRTRHQQGPAWATESDERLGLETLVAHASRGLPITPDPDPRLAPAVERGQARFHQRLGQLALSCTECHDQQAGQRLGGSVIPQGHPTGYPLYRLEWQALGSLQRRMRACLTGVRAEPWPDGAVEWTELELHLKRRAAGMPLETPAVRP
jgi:L-cysteine S-thiosulfotransferase